MTTTASLTTVPSYILGLEPALLHQGAEAKIYFTTLKGSACFVKERFPKQYRIPELDLRLRKKQLKNELRSLEMCKQNNIPCPLVLDSDTNNIVVYLQKLSGITVRQYVEQLGDLTLETNQSKVAALAQKIGVIVAQCHSIQVIHGDLTTSNMIIDVESPDLPLYLIDFGLAQISDNVEEKAVDLYVLERAVETTHANSEELIKLTLSAYEQYLNDFTSAALAVPSTPSTPAPGQDPAATAPTPSTIDNPTHVPATVLSPADADGLTTSPVPATPTNDVKPALTELQLLREQAKLDRQKRKEAAKKKTQTVLGGKAVMTRLNEVRARGRKKSMIG